MYKKTNKVIASMLLLILTLTQLSLIGIYGKEVYAADSNLEDQEVATNNKNVEFDAYFMVEGEKVHTATSNITDGSRIYAKVNVNNTGYLKNAQIEFKGEGSEKANFKLINQAENTIIQKIDEENSLVTLNQINSKEEQIIELPIEFNHSEEIKPSELSKENRVVFSGNYIDKDGKENKIEKEIIVKLNWEQEVRALLEEKVSKFIPYYIEDEQGLVLQTLVKTSVVDNALPIKSTTIESRVPIIDGLELTDVKVYTNSTKATNGQEEVVDFSEDNYSYNKETGILTITVENKIDENGKIKWSKDAMDEYKLTYTYLNHADDDTMQQFVSKVQLETRATIALYDNKQTVLTQMAASSRYYENELAQMTDTYIEKVTENLSKGYIYANYIAEDKIDTNYEQKIVAEVISANLTDKIIIEQNEEYIVEKDEDGEEIRTSTTNLGYNNTYYKTISISKDNIKKILGEEAQINIYNGENLLQSINSENINDAEETITINLSNKDINDIKIETSKPVAEGRLIFNVEKAIKGTVNYSNKQMQMAQQIVTSLKSTVNGIERTKSNEIALTEPKSKVELSIDKTDLSTIVKNEDVKIKAILKTDSIENNLFKNPTITIQLPKYIEVVEIKDVELMFDDELKIVSKNIKQNEDGTKSIVIQLEGTQTKYSIDSVTGGANVVITTDLTVNKFTSNRTEKVILTYTNKNEENATESVEKEINFIAPTGVVTTNKVTGYVDGGEIIALNGEDQTIVVETMKDARDINFQMSIINNYNNTIDSTMVLGRIASKDAKDKQLGMTLKDAITVTGVDASRVTVYYSTKADATKDLNDSSNGWVTTTTNYAEVKSYLIVISGELNTSDAIEFTYTTTLPANLEFDQTASEKFTVYFNNNLESGTIEDSQDSANIEITTGKGPVIETQITSSIPEDQTVYTDGIIKYTITVKNTGTKEATNVVAGMKVPRGTNYIEYTDNNEYTVRSDSEVIRAIGVLNIGESKTIDVYVKVKEIELEDFCTNPEHFDEVEVSEDGENEYIIKIHKDEYTHDFSEYELVTEAVAVSKASELNAQVVSNTVKNKLKRAMFYIDSYREDENWKSLGQVTDIEEETELKETFVIYSRTPSINIDNSIFTTEIPERLKYKSVELNGEQVKANYNKETRILTVELGTVNSERKELTVTYEAEVLSKDEYVRPLELSATLSSGKLSETSILKQYRIVKEGLEITQSANIPNGSVISTGEKITYKVTLKNIGSRHLILTLNDILPTELINNGGEYEINGEKTTYASSTDNNIKLVLHLKEGETAVVQINTIAGIVEKDTKITNVLTATTEELEVKSNEITYTIETTKYASGDDNDNDDESGDTSSTIAKIGGVVWKDEDKDGIKDENENLMSNVEVMLYNTNTSKVFTQNGTVVKAVTNENGLYTFNDVPAGNYLVIFLYDTGKYSATSYRINGKEDTDTSDAIDTKITLDGKQMVAAVTNIITLKEANLYNIDLGLVDNAKFDLSISKSISKVTVQDETGAKEYEFDENTSLAKVEFVQKHLNTTTIVVEYKIKVTNEGAVEGYVKKIADYLPKEMSFIAELNRDWYMNESGTIYNSSLANTKILPGETKEVTLVLTKAMNENSLGTVSNTAEIFEVYNEEALEDYDSTPANNASNEDDMSKADLVLSIKTGKYVMFIGLTIVIITIIGTSAYFIKKKVLI